MKEVGLLLPNLKQLRKLGLDFSYGANSITNAGIQKVALALRVNTELQILLLDFR